MSFGDMGRVWGEIEVITWSGLKVRASMMSELCARAVGAQGRDCMSQRWAPLERGGDVEWTREDRDVEYGGEWSWVRREHGWLTGRGG